MTPLLIGIAGPSGSGKTTLARGLAAALGEDHTAIIALDSYYRDLSALALEERARQNFDHPDALEWPLIREHMSALCQGRGVELPRYDFASHTRRRDTAAIVPRPYLILEGLFTLHDPELRELCGKRIFVTNSHEVCLTRRTERDVRERGRTAESVAAQYAATVQPMADAYIFPTAAHAGLTVVCTGDTSALVEEALAYIRA